MKNRTDDILESISRAISGIAAFEHSEIEIYNMRKENHLPGRADGLLYVDGRPMIVVALRSGNCDDGKIKNDAEYFLRINKSIRVGYYLLSLGNDAVLVDVEAMQSLPNKTRSFKISH